MSTQAKNGKESPRRIDDLFRMEVYGARDDKQLEFFNQHAEAIRKRMAPLIKNNALPQVVLLDNDGQGLGEMKRLTRRRDKEAEVEAQAMHNLFHAVQQQQSTDTAVEAMQEMLRQQTEKAAPVKPAQDFDLLLG